MDSDSYFHSLRQELDRAYNYAKEARKKGGDPEDDVEVKIASDLAARVEGIVGPPGIATIIRDMKKEGTGSVTIAFDIVKKICSGQIIKGTKEQLIDQAVRTGVGILTEGVLVAPTEGISKIKIKTNPDGSDYVAVYYSGPIRSAGGTAAALSVALADAARLALGIGDYRATDTQIERYVEEVNMYEARVTHLQYKPKDDDIRHIVKNCPVCIDGDPTEEIEVSGYRNVPGVETNRIRGGVPLVLCEGVAQKASKLIHYTKKQGIGWEWLEKIIKLSRKEDKTEIKPDDTYLEGLVAGRPVFSYPSEHGGFRIRYGKCRTNGIMAKAIHPATMILLDNFLAYGTHIKIERPGKGAVVTTNENIEPPVVMLRDGSVIKVKSIEQAEGIKNDVEEILFLGDILCTYGDFLKSNHPLVPAGYCEEYWEKELEEKSVRIPENHNTMPVQQLFGFSAEHNVPLHPRFTYNWSDISMDDLMGLITSLKGSTFTREGIVLDNTDNIKSVLEALLIEHLVKDAKIITDFDSGYALLATLGMINPDTLEIIHPDLSIIQTDLYPLSAVAKLSGRIIRNKAGTRIGARMGRPEKAKERKMDGSPNVLFPTGSMRNRSISKLYKTIKSRDSEKTVNLELARYRCQSCHTLSFSGKCHLCYGICKLENFCVKCGKTRVGEIHCDFRSETFERRPINIVELFESIKKTFNNPSEEVKGVKGLSNPNRVAERLEKGFARAKYGVFVFRDGTSRFDASDVPLTHFTPGEIGVSIEKLKSLGYSKDYLGNDIANANQLVPLKTQDILLAESGADYFIKISKFIDDLLINLYGLAAYYNINEKEDLIGHLAVGLSPHTSAAVLCRIIGFTKANVGYAHPYFHTCKRRNADGDEDSVMLLLDCLINFSRSYLTGQRGGTMDAPLVLTPKIEPKEVDDEVHSMEFTSSYPLELYRAGENYSSPGSVKVKKVKDVLDTPEQYEGIPLTHLGGYLDKGNTRTSYVTLQSIPEKIELQFSLQQKIRAVNKKDAAERLILSHFIPDLYGNLRSYSRQTFRCVACNNIYRRVPLLGRCIKCGGNLLLTINQGGIKKYLEISRKLAIKYDLPDYLKQRLELVEKEINSIFEDEKVKQMGLADFV